MTDLDDELERILLNSDSYEGPSTSIWIGALSDDDLERCIEIFTIENFRRMKLNEEIE